MKVVVIGTSNSIIGLNGYIKELKKEHNVDCFLCGRVPFFYHISVILENLKKIESSDVLIIDHYVNDVQLYQDEIDDYYEMLNLFYSILSSLNVFVFNVFFPILELSDKEIFKDEVVSLSDDYGFISVDFNGVGFRYYDFIDNIHLNRKSSSIIGVFLLGVLDKVDCRCKPFKGELLLSPFTFIKADEVFESVKLNFKNSIVDFDYYKVDEPFSIDSKVISIGYFSNGKDFNAVDINGEKVFLNGKGYFHDYIKNKLSIDSLENGLIDVKPVFGFHSDVFSLMNREVVSEVFSGACISDFLFYNKDIEIDVKFSEKNFKLDLNMHRLSSIVFNSDSFFDSLKYKTVDRIRDLAISFEDSDLFLSFDLMRIANKSRPGGKFIKDKLESYKKSLFKKTKN